MKRDVTKKNESSSYNLKRLKKKEGVVVFLAIFFYFIGSLGFRGAIAQNKKIISVGQSIFQNMEKKIFFIL